MSDKTELVLVECVQQHRIRYLIQVPEGKMDWALDTVTMQDAFELEQYDLGEIIVSHRVLSIAESLEIINENLFGGALSDEEKLETFVTIIDDEDYNV